MIAIRDNDANDSFAIVSGGANYQTDTTYDKLVARFRCNGNTNIGGTLDIAGETVCNSTLRITDTIAHVSDSNTKIRFPENDKISFETAGTERLRIDNVGVLYTGNYTTTLDATPGSIQMSGGTSGARLSLRGTSTSAYAGLGEMHGYWDTNKVSSILFHAGADTSNKDDGEIRFYTRLSGGATSERLRIKSDGELVINHNQSSTPLNNTFLSIYDANSDSSAIDASGISKNYAMISLHNYGTGVVGDATGIGFGAGSGFSYTKGSIAFQRQGSYGTGDLVFLTNNDQNTTMVNNTDEKMRITRDGLIQAYTLSGSYYPIASVKDGSTSARAATSAWEIKKTLGPRARNGYYYLINPYDGTTNTWWCDMDTDGGGWILVAHTGDGGMSDQGTGGDHWYSRNNKGGFDTVGAGYYTGGGYWRTSAGAWSPNTCGQLMWDVRTHYSEFDNRSNDKVVFNWGTDQAIPTGSSSYSNIPNASNRRFADWCYAVENAPGFNPMNYDNNVRSNVINGAEHFTEHMLMTWSFRNTSGNADNGSSGPYWQIGAHANGLHQHYEESISGDSYGDGSYQVISNEDTTWGGGGTNNGYRRIARDAGNGTCNVWLR